MNRMLTARRVLITVGALLMAYALVIVFTGKSFHPVGQAIFLVAVLIGHDGVIAPISIIVGLLLTRWLPTRIRSVIQAALYASLVVSLVALPFVSGRGRSVDNPSALPLNYTSGWLWLLAVIWLTAAVVLGWRLRPSTRPARRGGAPRS